MTKHLDFAINTAELAAKKLMTNFKKHKPKTRETSTKIKSKYDFLADNIIIKEIEKYYPTYSYLTEETGWVKKDPKNIWIVDPLDGTGNFVNNNPFFTVSIALWQNNEPVVGIMEAPALSERYFAIKNKGAWVVDLKTQKKKKARVSATKKLTEAYIVSCEGGAPRKKSVAIYDQLYPKVKDMKKIGSATLELVWVGTGQADVYITPQTNLWDIGAGILFVKEAGGELFNFDLKRCQWKDFVGQKKINLIATNGKIKLPKIKF